MKRKEEYKHLKKLWKKMQRHFKESTRSKAPEELHQFRVQVKKVRSFLTLLETNDKNKQLLELFKPVKKIFKSAGITRDALLHQQEAKEHKVNLPEFYKEQDKIQKKEMKKLVSKRQKHLKKMKQVKKELKRHLHPVTDNEIRTFFTTQLHNTYNLLSRHDFSEQLHEGRKMLKHLMYNESLAHDGIGKDLNINFAYIDELQEVLGKWHDNKLTLTFFSKKKLSNKDIDSMKTKNSELQKAITEKAQGFKQKIIAEEHSNSE